MTRFLARTPHFIHKDMQLIGYLQSAGPGKSITVQGKLGKVAVVDLTDGSCRVGKVGQHQRSLLRDHHECHVNVTASVL